MCFTSRCFWFLAKRFLRLVRCSPFSARPGPCSFFGCEPRCQLWCAVLGRQSHQCVRHLVILVRPRHCLLHYFVASIKPAFKARADI